MADRDVADGELQERHQATNWRHLGVTQKSAWFMFHRIREAMKNRSMISWDTGGAVESDETFVGGNLRTCTSGAGDHAERDDTRAPARKDCVQGMLDRESRQVRAKVVPNVKRETLQEEILKNECACVPSTPIGLRL